MIAKLTNKLRSWWSIDRIFQTLAIVLFFTYLLQLYVFYAIDSRQVLDAGMTLFIFFLRWTTIVSVGLCCCVPFFGGKITKPLVSIFGPVVGLLNLIFYKQNMIAWGSEAYAPWRATLFVIEQFLVLAISIYYLVMNIKNKAFKKLNPIWVILTIVGLYASFMYQSVFSILLGTSTAKAEGFSSDHIKYLIINPIFIIGGYILMKNKSMESKKVFFALLACSGVFNFFYYEYGGYGSLPFHLCNAAIVLMFLAFVFNLKGIFYFTYFVNVVGALFAMIWPNTVTDPYCLGVVRFWYNHIYAFCLPILGVALGVYPRPTIKFMSKAIGFFTLYFVLMIVFNAWFSNYDSGVDYFFLNSNFLFEKIKAQPTIKDNYVITLAYKDLVFRLYPVFYAVVYFTYIGLMFVIWFIYDSLYHVADSHYALHVKKKLIKNNYLDLKAHLKNKKLDDPLYEEKKNMIEIEHFTKIYSGSKTPSVDDFSLKIHEGEVFGFLGHNGAGKSTTIKSIVGIQSITSGRIVIDGYDVTKQPVEAKLRIGYVSDNHAVYEKLTGREYINYIADLYMVNQEDRDARIDKYTKMFKLEDAMDKEIKSYSHGMKQKIVVIASLIHDPKVWILDEPLTGLDPTSAYQIKECMKEHASRGNIVFFSSHVIEVVEKVCTKICIINHGKLQCVYSLDELKQKGMSLEELYLKYVTNQESEPNV